MLRSVKTLLAHRPRIKAVCFVVLDASLGGMMALGFAPYHQHLLAWLAMACWAYRLAEATPCFVFPCLWAYLGVGLPWLHHAIHLVAPFPTWFCRGINVLACAALACLMTWPFALARSIQRAWSTSPLVFALAWVAAEASTAWLLGAWRCFGYSQAPHGWWLGWAPWLGAMGLSTLLAYGAALLAATCKHPRRFYPMLLLWTVATICVQPHHNKLSRPPWLAHTVLVDGHSHPWHKWYPGGGQASLHHYLQRTLDVHPPPQSLVIWPETAIAGVDHTLMPDLTKLSITFHQHGWGLVTGILHRDPTTSQLTNAALGLGDASGRVDKHRLVAFGEYLPYPKLLLPLWHALGLPGFYVHPSQHVTQVINWRGHRLAVLICYDVVDVERLRYLRPPIDALLVITDDSWFQSDSMVAQHRQIASFRGAELQRPVVFANNSFPT